MTDPRKRKCTHHHLRIIYKIKFIVSVLCWDQTRMYIVLLFYILLCSHKGIIHAIITLRKFLKVMFCKFKVSIYNMIHHVESTFKDLHRQPMTDCYEFRFLVGADLLSCTGFKMHFHSGISKFVISFYFPTSFCDFPILYFPTQPLPATSPILPLVSMTRS